MVYRLLAVDVARIAAGLMSTAEVQHYRLGGIQDGPVEVEQGR
jgi:hypothetical protein